jgi:hypothetical protein
MSISTNSLGTQMTENVKKFLELAKKKFKRVESQSTDKIELLAEKIDKLASLITLMVLNQHSDNITSSIGKIKELGGTESLKEGNQKMATDQLEEITTCQKGLDGARTFLLHRPTPNSEYQDSIDGGFYEPKEKTEWVAEYEVGRSLQESDNPVISCWVPESAIDHIPTPHDNTGTWGDLGDNPSSHKYRVIVKPGKFEVYQTLKQQ